MSQPRSVFSIPPEATLVAILIGLGVAAWLSSGQQLSNDGIEEQKMTASPAATFEELADRGAVLEVIGVHYLITGAGLVCVTIFEDTVTNQRVRNATVIAEKSFPKDELQEQQDGFWVIGDRAKLYLRDDGTVVYELITK